MSALLSLDSASVVLGARRALTDVALASGHALLGGAVSRSLSARGRALRAAYLPQRPQSIWPISVEALVALGRFAHGAAPDRLAASDQAAVDAAIDACALSALRARRMDEISGGEKARAHLARALAQQAPLLVLDEPTAGLDPAQALGVAAVLRTHAAQGGGVLISTHDVALAARIAGRVLLLREGETLALGAPQEALSADTLYAAYGRAARIEKFGGQVIAIFD
jgi:iron complex transport system ATP-binding protein